MKKFLGWTVLGSALALVLACAKPPTMEMTDAENAVNAAEQAGALEYATADFQTAQNALADAKAKLESKDYPAARTAALDAKAKAEAAAAAVSTGKAAAEAQARAGVAELEKEFKDLKNRAAKAKGAAAAKIKSAVNALEADWTRVKEDLVYGSYAKVNAAVESVRNRLGEVKDDLAGGPKTK